MARASEQARERVEHGEAAALRLRAVACRAGDAGLIVTVSGPGGHGGISVAPNEPGVAAAVERYAEAWAGMPLLAIELRWRRWGRAAMANRPDRLAYGAIDLACADAARAALGLPMAALIGGETGGSMASKDGAADAIDFNALAGPEDLARHGLGGDAVGVDVPLQAAGGLGGLRRVVAVARALNLQVRLRADSGSAVEQAQAAALGSAFGCDVAAGHASAPRDEVQGRIRRVRLRRVRIPLVHPYVSAMYLTQEVRRTIIEVECDDGTVGLGETGGSDEIWLLAQKLARPMIGADAFDRRGMARRFAPVGYANANGRSGFQAIGGLELACWDAVARRIGVPLADLLGRGDPAEEVAAVCLLPAAGLDRLITRRELAAHFADLGNVQRLVEQARAARDRYGFTCFKYKSVGGNVRWDLAVMQALRAALPGAELRFDPNAAYATADAQALCRAMEPLALQFYEDPTDGIEGLARLRRGLTRPVASNMVLIHFDHFAPAVHRRALDVLLADLFHWGGVETFRDMAAAAEAFGLKAALHSFYETGVATAANLHLALGLGLTGFANDQGHEGLAEDVLAPGALPIRGGRMALPAGPGLGVTLDETRMRRLTTDELVLGGEAA